MIVPCREAADVVAAIALARREGKAARAPTWERTLGALGDEEAAEFAGAPLHRLRALLDGSYLGEDLRKRGRSQHQIRKPAQAAPVQRERRTRPGTNDKEESS
jgi:hypothetical protein